MLKRYLDFINESINESIDLILESDVIFSDKFRSVLKNVSTKSELAKVLMEIENKDLPVRSNYFDILSDDNNKVSFIPDSKAQEILKDVEDKVRFTGSGGGWLKHKSSNNGVFNALGYTYDEGKNPHSPNSHEIGDVIGRTVSESSGNVYVWVKWKNDSGDEVGEGVYNNQKLTPYDNRLKEVWSKSRQDLKIGKAIRALLKSANIEFLDKDLESLVNELKAEIAILNDKFSYFNVVKGDDIPYWYDYRKYEEQRGTLGGSCMKDVGNYYFDLYVKNPDVCQLVILKSEKNNDKIIGRALLWKLTDDNFFMDRIYTINDADVNLFREYAKKNGWYSKYYNNSTDDIKAIAPDGNTVDSLSGVVNIKPGYYEGYTYMDTLKWFTPDSGKLSVHSGQYNLESTGGSLDDEECEYCGGSGEYECGECYGSGEITCHNCEGSGEIECENCSGSGKDGEEECSDCSGSGEKECNFCGGSGEEDCDECNGYGEISCYNC